MATVLRRVVNSVGGNYQLPLKGLPTNFRIKQVPVERGVLDTSVRCYISIF
jgi:hypothetical protein